MGLLHKEMQFLLGLPKLRIVARLPGIDRKVGQIPDTPLTFADVLCVIHRDLAASLRIAEEVVAPLAIDHHARSGNRDHLRAATSEREGGSTLGDLSLVPLVAVVPHQPILGYIALRIAPIGGDVGIPCGIGTHAGLVDQLAVLGDAAGVLRMLEADRERVLFARRFFPRLAAILRAGVAEVVVGLYEPGFAPHPREVDCPFGINVELPIGVAPILAIDQHILYALPPFVGADVAVEDQISAPRSPRAVGKQQIAIGEAVKFGVGDILLLAAHHLLFFAQRERVGRDAAAVVERVAVVVEGYMQIPLAIYADADHVVGILHVSAVLAARKLPHGALEVTHTDNHPPLVVVVGDVLPPVGREE